MVRDPGLVRERQARLDLVDVGRMELLVFAQTTPPLGAFAGQQVAHSGMAREHLSAGANFKALGDRFFGFDPLGTTHKKPRFLLVKGREA